MGSHRRPLEAVPRQGPGRWGKLTDSDLDVINGKREQLAGRIQEAYGKTKETAEREIDEFCFKCVKPEDR